MTCGVYARFLPLRLLRRPGGLCRGACASSVRADMQSEGTTYLLHSVGAWKGEIAHLLSRVMGSRTAVMGHGEGSPVANALDY